jgi:hypothetical protein
MPKYLQISRSDYGMGYVECAEGMLMTLESEFEDLQDLEVGTKFSLTVVEMTEEEFNKLPEFQGW